MPADRRTVVCEPRFIRELEAMRVDGREADSFVSGAEWLLSRNPTAGRLVHDAVWFLPIVDEERLDQLVLYYTFDDETVWLLSIQTTGFSPHE